MSGTDRSKENRVLFWMCVLIGTNQLGFGAIVPNIAPYAHAFGVTNTAIGLTIAGYGLGRMLAAPPSGGMSDRFGRRPSLALGGVITAVGNLLCGLSDTYFEFLGARFIAGAGAGLVLTTGQIVLADISSPERRGRMISIYQATFLFAVGVGPYPGGLIADRYGLDAPFFAYAGFALLCAVVAWFAVGETREIGGRRAGGSGGPRLPFLQQLRLLAANRGYVLVCIVSLMFAVIRTGGFFAIIPIIGAVTLGLTASQIGLGLLIGSIAGLAASYPAGMISDRFGRKPVIVPASIATSASMCVFAYAEGYPLFMIACIAWGIATSVGGAAPAAYAADSAPPGMNAVTVSTFRMLGDVGYVVGPLLLGVIADATGPGTSLLIGAGMMVSAALVFAVFAPETWRGGKL